MASLVCIFGKAAILKIRKRKFRSLQVKISTSRFKPSITIKKALKTEQYIQRSKINKILIAGITNCEK